MPNFSQHHEFSSQTRSVETNIIKAGAWGENKFDALCLQSKHASDRFIIGGPETAIEEFKRYEEDIEMDDVILRMHFPGLNPSKSRKSMRIIADALVAEIVGELERSFEDGF